MTGFAPLMALQFVPLLADFEILQALIPVVTIIILVLSQVLGGKDKKPAAQRAEQQRRLEQQRAEQRRRARREAADEHHDPISQEIDEFLRNASGEQPQRQPPQGQRAEQRPEAAGPTIRQRVPKKKPRRGPYDPMQPPSRQPDGGRPVRNPSRPPRTDRPPQVEPDKHIEIVEATVVAPDAPQRGRLSEHHLKSVYAPPATDLGLEHYDSVDRDNERLDLGASHSFDTNIGGMGSASLTDLPIDGPHDAQEAVAAREEIDFVSGIVGIFRDPEQTRKAIIAREILDRPNY